MLTMRGPAAQVRAGFEVAAELGAWELTRDGESFELHAPVLKRNTFWLDSGYPLDLTVTVGRSSWCWRKVRVSGDNPLTVLGEGRPEVS